MPTMIAVASSSIRAIGYDERARELWIEYRGSPTPYAYLGIPQEVYTGLCEAESKGGYINRVVKRYPYEYRGKAEAAIAMPCRG